MIKCLYGRYQVSESTEQSLDQPQTYRACSYTGVERRHRAKNNRLAAAALGLMATTTFAGAERLISLSRENESTMDYLIGAGLTNTSCILATGVLYKIGENITMSAGPNSSMARLYPHLFDEIVVE